MHATNNYLAYVNMKCENDKECRGILDSHCNAENLCVCNEHYTKAHDNSSCWGGLYLYHI